MWLIISPRLVSEMNGLDFIFEFFKVIKIAVYAHKNAEKKVSFAPHVSHKALPCNGENCSGAGKTYWEEIAGSIVDDVLNNVSLGLSLSYWKHH
jgi:hypothetical protein